MNSSAVPRPDQGAALELYKLAINGFPACLRDGTRGYALLAPSPAPTGAPVAPTTKPTAAPPPVVAPPAPAEGSDGAAATPLGVAAAVLALLLA